jgi:hypothetical protein
MFKVGLCHVVESQRLSYEVAKLISNTPAGNSLPSSPFHGCLLLETRTLYTPSTFLFRPLKFAALHSEASIIHRLHGWAKPIRNSTNQNHAWLSPLALLIRSELSSENVSQPQDYDPANQHGRNHIHRQLGAVST